MLGHRQLRRGLLGARTSLAMKRAPRCSDIASYVGAPWCSDIASYVGDSSVLGHHQLRWGLFGARTSPATMGTPRCSDIASYAGDSSVLRHRQLRWGLLGARTSLARLGTPLMVGSCYVSSVCYQAAPCCSDQGADLGQHVWDLDTRMSDDIGKL